MSITKFSHSLIERNVGLLLVLVILTVSVGGLVEIVPLFFPKIDNRTYYRSEALHAFAIDRPGYLFA